MKIDDEFRRLLRSLSIEVSLSLRKEERQYQIQAAFDAQRTGAIVPLAYSEARLHAFERRVRLTIDRYFSALENCGIEVDDEAEKVILGEISRVTAANPHLMFPPAIRGLQASAVQQSHAIKMSRLSQQLYKEVTNRLREEKIKARSRADANASQVAGQVTTPTIRPRYIPTNVRREARRLDTQAMYQTWQKECRSLKRSNPNMSDVWCAQKISKMGIAKGRSADTIRKHMR